jgi:hypothetical protein
MENKDKEILKPIMDKYELYLQTDVSVLNRTDIETIAKYTRPFCQVCLDEIIEATKKVYEDYKI